MTKKSKIIKLNIGCGESKLDGFINIDTEKSVKPDLVFDITKGKLPFPPNSVSVIHCIHNIEHIEIRFWEHVFTDFWRVLKPKGYIILAYPEFEKCAHNFLTNKNGEKDFWRATLYGRQLYDGDYHVTPVVTKDLIKLLFKYGFDEIKAISEPDADYNSAVRAYKGKKSLTKEDILRKQIFERGKKKR